MQFRRLGPVLEQEDIGERVAADRVETAVQRVLKQGTTVTPDLGGTATTRQLTDAIIAEL